MLQLTPNLPSLVAKRFIAAKESGTLIFSPTQLTTIQSSGVVVSNPRLLIFFNQQKSKRKKKKKLLTHHTII